jgi:hypothetical protein
MSTDTVGRKRAETSSGATPTASTGVILVDTSVWVDHLRSDDRTLGAIRDHRLMNVAERLGVAALLDR